MIKFDPNKEKNINFTINVQGIDPNLLEYNLRISSGDIDYGFRGKNNNGSISFSIPPLNEVTNEKIIDSLKSIKMEVNDKNNKYYLKPFEDTVKIEASMKVDAKLSEERDDDPLPDVKANLSEDKDKPDFDVRPPDIDKVDKKTNKNSKLSKFLSK